MSTLTQDLYLRNPDFQRFVKHWANKQNVSIEEVLSYKISDLYASQLKEKEDTIDERIFYEIRQDNGI